MLEKQCVATLGAQSVSEQGEVAGNGDGQSEFPISGSGSRSCEVLLIRFAMAIRDRWHTFIVCRPTNPSLNLHDEEYKGIHTNE